MSVTVEALDCTFIPIDMLGGCGASGVWATGDAGINWTAVGNDELTGVKITDIKVTPFSLGREIVNVWVASENGLYRGTYNLEEEKATWTKITPTPPAGYDAVPNIVTVCPSKFIEQEVYFLAHDNTNDVVWVYFSYDNGDTWRYTTIGRTEWTDLDGGVNNNPVYTLSPGPLGQMYIGGWCWFPTDTWAFNRWGRWTGFQWEAVGDGVEDIVNVQCQGNYGYIYAAGAFEDGAGDQLVARWTGTSFSYLPACPINEEIGALEWQNNGQYLWAAGGSVGAPNSVYYYSDFSDSWVWPGEPDQFTGTLDGNPGGWVEGIAIDGYNVYVTGNFTHIGALECNGVAKWNGSSWSAISDGLPDGSRGYAIVVDEDHNVYVGGRILGIMDGNPVYHCVKWDGAEWTWVGNAASTLNDTVRALKIDDNGVLWAGGDFTGYVKYWDEAFQLWRMPTDTGPDDAVHTIAFDNNGNPWIGGDFVNADGNVVNYVSRLYSTGGHLPSVGQTHLLDMSADGQYLYIGMLNTSDEAMVCRLTWDLKDPKTLYYPGAGSWAGVACDPYYANIVWAFGELGAEKVLFSEDYGETWLDSTEGSWTGTVRPLLISYWDTGDVIAVDNGTLEAWQTKDYGATWVKRGDTAFGAQCGARDPWEPLNIWIGRTTAGAQHIQYSPNDGAGWAEHSGGFTADAPVTALAVIG